MTAIKKLGLDHGIAPKKRISEEFDPQYTWRYSQSKMIEAEIVHHFTNRSSCTNYDNKPTKFELDK